MGLKSFSCLSLTATFKGCLNAHLNGYAIIVRNLWSARRYLYDPGCPPCQLQQLFFGQCRIPLQSHRYASSHFISTCSQLHIHPEDFIFVDYEALNDRITSTAETNTPRLGSFRQNVMNRDGELCIITRESEQFCEAAHLIPKCKGDEVFFLVSGYVMFFEQLRFLVHSEDY